MAEAVVVVSGTLDGGWRVGATAYQLTFTVHSSVCQWISRRHEACVCTRQLAHPPPHHHHHHHTHTHTHTQPHTHNHTKYLCLCVEDCSVTDRQPPTVQDYRNCYSNCVLIQVCDIAGETGNEAVVLRVRLCDSDHDHVRTTGTLSDTSVSALSLTRISCVSASQRHCPTLTLPLP
jgi:hypothetical protein